MRGIERLTFTAVSLIIIGAALLLPLAIGVWLPDVFLARREMELSDVVAADVAFHMTDWLDDLDAYSRFCADPRGMSDQEVNELLTRFLVHIPNHVAAASKLYTGVPVTDIFGVSATSEEGDDVS